MPGGEAKGNDRGLGRGSRLSHRAVRGAGNRRYTFDMLEPTPTPASEFGERIDEHLRRLTRAKGPTMLTRRGKAAAFVLSPRQYHSLQDAAEFLDTVRAVVESRKQIARGEHMSIAAAKARLRSARGVRRVGTV